MSETSKSIDRKYVSGCQGGGGEQDDGECVQMGTWFLLGLMKMFWNWIMVMAAEPCEYTKIH